MNVSLPLRKQCHCGCSDGRVVTKNGQDCVYCSSCGKHHFNAPKTETGRKVRSLATTHAAIKPKQRWRIIERAGGVCESCRCVPTSEQGLHVGHVVSVKDGHYLKLSDAIINSDENLIAQCGQCNSGASERTFPLHLYVAILRARIECTHDKPRSTSETQQHG